MSVVPFTTSQSRWQACINRDPSAHNSFIMGVKTTKIYCRPTCPARLARRANVVFYDTPAEAEEEGLRACRRCKPDIQSEAGDEEARRKKVIEDVCRWVEERGVGVVESEGTPGEGGEAGSSSGTTTPNSEKPRLADMAKMAGLTPWHFHRVFKKALGVTPAAFVNQVAANRAKGGSASQEAARRLSVQLGSSSMPNSSAAIAPASSSNIQPAPAQSRTGAGPSNYPTPGTDYFPLSDSPTPTQSQSQQYQTHLSRSASSQSYANPMTPLEPNQKHIIYTIQPWLTSWVLIAASTIPTSSPRQSQNQSQSSQESALGSGPGQQLQSAICALDISHSPSDLIATLYQHFSTANITASKWTRTSPPSPSPGPGSPTLMPLSSFPPTTCCLGSSDDALHHRTFEKVMDALERPSGREVDVVFDLETERESAYGVLRELMGIWGSGSG